jgi:uncharacterized membrane protein YgcG
MVGFVVLSLMLASFVAIFVLAVTQTVQQAAAEAGTVTLADGRRVRVRRRGGPDVVWTGGGGDGGGGASCDGGGGGCDG